MADRARLSRNRPTAGQEDTRPLEALEAVEHLTRDAARLLLFILPGIISIRIKSAFAISAPSKPFNMTIDALILTLLNHALYGIVRWGVDLIAPLSVKDFFVAMGSVVDDSPSWPGDLGSQFNQAGGFSIIGIALVVGVVSGVVRYHGWEFSLFRRLKMTNRTGENLVWTEVLTKASRIEYALVTCKDGVRYIGIIDTFSEEAGNYELFLAKASQVQADGELLPISGQGVLLTRENPIVRVELWKSEETAKNTSGGEEHA
jgi:hypothetical protein